MRTNANLRSRLSACRVGYAFTAKCLDAEQRHAIESALWAALRALEESISLSQRLAKADGGLETVGSSRHLSGARRRQEKHAKVLRDFK